MSFWFEVAIILGFGGLTKFCFFMAPFFYFLKSDCYVKIFLFKNIGLFIFYESITYVLELVFCLFEKLGVARRFLCDF